MSFQDVGKPGASKRKGQKSRPSSSAVIPEDAVALSGAEGFAQISDQILQYQRNVGILEKIVRQVGTKADTPVLDTQYKVQVDVLRQLGDKLEEELRAQEEQLQSLPRQEASKRRATHVKLTRDFRRVEGNFKNLQLDMKRKRARAIEQQSREEQKRPAPETEEENIQLQMQLQQDRLNEQIMQEREEEIRSINKGMHQVNEIYKDLAHIVGGQQEQIDQIETQMEESKTLAQDGLKHVEKANERAAAGNCTIS